MFDNDRNNPSTSKKAQNLADYLSAFGKAMRIQLPIGEDPGGLSKEEIKGILKKYGIA